MLTPYMGPLGRDLAKTAFGEILRRFSDECLNKFIPFHPAIGEARAKIEAFEVEVRSAESQAEVAGAFGTLVRLASANDLTVVDADIKADCEYTTGEIVIIVIGFILAIIPGIIFMAILC